MGKLKSIIPKLLFFLGGLYIVTVGMVIVKQSGLGVDPWMVFHMGISNYVPFTVGQVTQGVGAIMLLIGWALKIKPSIGTFLNMFCYGYFLDLNITINDTLNIIQQTDSLIVSILYLLIGIIIIGVGLGIYLNGQLGVGPRDGFMVGISNVTGKKPGTIKTWMECTAVFIGWLLGGPLGIGTLVYALSVGSVMQWTLDRVKLPQPKEVCEEGVAH
ncbi:MAG: hypothetical protein WBJ82_04760 [Tepidanaerobacteraceae bacterium]|nr:membrane protein [Tepidanaerobacter sp.]HQE05978.1 hypothetical protein [Tepidanaerobacteraceae bacterium]